MSKKKPTTTAYAEAATDNENSWYLVAERWIDCVPQPALSLEEIIECLPAAHPARTEYEELVGDE